MADFVRWILTVILKRTDTYSEPKKTDIYSEPEKWRRISDLTLNNYSNMNKRLVHKKKMAESILVYYSLALIILSLTSKYFYPSFNTILGEYFGIVFSVALLAYSLINNTAKYSQRIIESQRAINDIKTLKREIGNDLETFKQQYIQLVDKLEIRDDIDFFRTLKQQCKEFNISYWKPGPCDDSDTKISELKNHLSEINIPIVQLRILLMYLTDVILLLLPPAIFVFCFLY